MVHLILALIYGMVCYIVWCTLLRYGVVHFFFITYVLLPFGYFILCVSRLYCRCRFDEITYTSSLVMGCAICKER